MPQTKLSGYLVNYHNSEEFHELKREIFTHQIYYFETDNPHPVIIDAGAHIGLATLYFKKLYPAAQIIAIEPQADNFALLEKNIWDNNLSQVSTYQLALSDHEGQQTFYFDQTAEWLSTASLLKGAWNQAQTDQSSLIVPTQTLAHFLTQPIDFLKLDIEGAEQIALLSAGEKIKQVKHLICEFHPTQTQSLGTIINFLENHHFQVKSAKTHHGLSLIEAKLTT